VKDRMCGKDQVLLLLKSDKKEEEVI